MKELTKISATLFFLILPLVCLAAEFQPNKVYSAGVIKFEEANWVIYTNDERGYSLKMPAQLQVNFKKSNDRQWAVENRMPFDYVNFRPQQASGEVEPFELGIGVHWNRDNLGTREFADKKDEGLKLSGAQIVTIRQAEVSVAGIKGVRDDFRLRQPDGWKSYSRVIIPYKDNFFVFLATLGKDKPVSEYEGVFQEILESFELIGP